MSDTYFSDRERGPRPRTGEQIQAPAWGGIVVLLESLISNGAFGVDFTAECPDVPMPIGTYEQAFDLALRAELPELARPWNPEDIPSTLSILDLIEFSHEHVASPIQKGFHDYYGHYHLSFNREEGQARFRNRINLIFARNGLAFELDKTGRVVRLGPPILRASLREASFRTGDPTLDSMLETARAKYLDPDPIVRRESLEKLWDSWERLKSMESGKKTSPCSCSSKRRRLRSGFGRRSIERRQN